MQATGSVNGAEPMKLNLNSIRGYTKADMMPFVGSGKYPPTPDFFSESEQNKLKVRRIILKKLSLRLDSENPFRALK
jgi:hypothetical protein